MKSIPEIGVDTRLLAQAIEVMIVGSTLTYTHLSSLIGRDVRQKARGNLTSARRIALRTHKIVTESVINVGIKRLTDIENINVTGESARKRVRNITAIAMHKLESIGDFDALPNPFKIKHSAEKSQLSALRIFSKDNIGKRLENKIGDSMQQLSIAKTLEVFKE